MKDSAAAPRTILAVHPGAELFGSDRMFLESIIGLHREGENVVVALPAHGALSTLLAEQGVHVVVSPSLVLRKALLRPRGWPTLAKDLVRNVLTGARLISKLRPDALYVNTVTLPMWPMLGRIRGVRVITHLHEAESMASRLVQGFILLPQVAAQTIIVNSEFTRDTTARAQPLLRRRMRVVYNGVHGPQAPGLLESETPQTLRLLFVGRLSPRKGPDVAIRALRLLIDRGIEAHLTVVGSSFVGYEWFSEDLRRLTETLQLGEHVTFSGFQDDIWGAAEDAHLLLVPSTADESFGNVAVEGVLAQRPVVFSDISGLSEAMAPYPTAFPTIPGNPEDLARAVTDLVQAWPSVAAGTAESALLAQRKHGVEEYRARISAIVRSRTTTGEAAQKLRLVSNRHLPPSEASQRDEHDGARA